MAGPLGRIPGQALPHVLFISIDRLASQGGILKALGAKPLYETLARQVAVTDNEIQQTDG